MRLNRKRRILKRFMQKHGFPLQGQKSLDDNDWNLKRIRKIKKIRKNIGICEKILKIISLSNKNPNMLTTLQEKKGKMTEFKQKIENLKKKSPKRLFSMYIR